MTKPGGVSGCHLGFGHWCFVGHWDLVIGHCPPGVTVPKLAAFPKAWLDDLCVTGYMSLRQWIDLGATFGVDGLEFYTGFLGLQDPNRWIEARHTLDDR